MSNNPQARPYIPTDLIEFLHKVYPERAPNPEDSEREVWMKAGERRLVNWLQALYDIQEQDPLHVHF